jgi:hypothetical protein
MNEHDALSSIKCLAHIWNMTFASIESYLHYTIMCCRDILRWGRNIVSSKTRTRKRAGIAVYNRASSLETLVCSTPKHLIVMCTKYLLFPLLTKHLWKKIIQDLLKITLMDQPGFVSRILILTLLDDSSYRSDIFTSRTSSVWSKWCFN